MFFSSLPDTGPGPQPPNNGNKNPSNLRTDGRDLRLATPPYPWPGVRPLMWPPNPERLDQTADAKLSGFCSVYTRFGTETSPQPAPDPARGTGFTNRRPGPGLRSLLKIRGNAYGGTLSTNAYRRIRCHKDIKLTRAEKSTTHTNFGLRRPDLLQPNSLQSGSAALAEGL